MSDSTSRPVRFVVFHSPGPAWQYGTDFREQKGVAQHVQHYLEFFKQGKLEMGGPYLIPDAGGMMIPNRDITQKEMEDYASADPAVKSGLLVYEIRPWLTAMDRD
jgi:uncharacterized protein YciI